MYTTHAKRPNRNQTLSRFEQHRHRALELFALRGYGQVSLRQLAAELELTVGTLYHHCTCKEELLFEFIEEHYQALLALFDRRRRSPSLAMVLDGLWRMFERSPLHFQVALHNRHCLNGGYLERIEELRTCLARSLSTILLETSGAARAYVFHDAALALFEQMPLWAPGEQSFEIRRELYERLLLATVDA